MAGRGTARPLLPRPVTDALAAEGLELLGLARRLAPTRRRGALVGLALLAVIAMAGVAGASEPQPANRSALDAFSGPAAPAASGAPAASAVPAASGAPAASVAPATSADAGADAAAAPLELPTGALGATAMFTGPDPLDIMLKGGLVVAALFITLRILRRVQGHAGGKATGMLDVVESRNLGPKTQLHLVAVGDRRFMVGQTPAGLVALGELDAAELLVGGIAPLMASQSAIAPSTDLAACADIAAPELVVPRAASTTGQGGRPSRARSTVGPDRGSGALSISSLYAAAPAALPASSATVPAATSNARRTTSRVDRPARVPGSAPTPVPAPASAPAPAPVPAAIDPRLSDAERLGGETRQERLARIARQEAQDRADRQARVARAERAARVEQAMAAADRAARIAASAAAAAERAALADRTAQAVERTGLAPLTMGAGPAPRPLRTTSAPSNLAATRLATRRPDPAARLGAGRTAARPEGISEIEARLIERLASLDLEGRSADRAFAGPSALASAPNLATTAGGAAGPAGSRAPREGLADRLSRSLAARLAAASPVIPATGTATPRPTSADGLSDAADHRNDDRQLFGAELDNEPATGRVTRAPGRYEASA